MKTITSAATLRQQIDAWQRAGDTVALVPTMGNLHDGHRSLLELGRARADHLVCSIFVNPTQFGPEEDLAAYPRTPDADLAMLNAAGTDIAFLPDVPSMYPPGDQTLIQVPALSQSHCGRSRPGHFQGVATVVCKLLNLVRPDIAVFGEKDYQQLAVIRRMASDLFLTVDILGAPTRRADDGLALSSRNGYLSTAERTRAPELYRTLQWVQHAIVSGARDFRALEIEAANHLRASGFETDYFSVSRQHDLTAANADDPHLVILGAAWLGRARLIDNLAWERPNQDN